MKAQPLMVVIHDVARLLANCNRVSTEHCIVADESKTCFCELYCNYSNGAFDNSRKGNGKCPSCLAIRMMSRKKSRLVLQSVQTGLLASQRKNIEDMQSTDSVGHVFFWFFELLLLCNARQDARADNKMAHSLFFSFITAALSTGLQRYQIVLLCP